MAVVINEFEVVPESQTSNTQAAAASSGTPASSGRSAHEIKLIMIRLTQRYARVRAH